MSIQDLIGGVIVVLLAVYLLATLLRPEEF
jgi:K+-transporting ATPase KdpF subunit